MPPSMKTQQQYEIKYSNKIFHTPLSIYNLSQILGPKTYDFFVNSYHLKQLLMRNNWKRLILMKTPTKILLHLICLLENASKQLISF